MNWIPSNLRVKRLLDGKIFSTSVGAARHYDKRIAQQIEHCCNGFLAMVEDSSWEWVFEDRVYDVGDIEDLNRRLEKSISQSSKKQVNYYTYIGKAVSPSYRQSSFVLVSFFRYWIGIHNKDGKDDYRTPPIQGKELYKELCKFCERNNYDIPFSGSAGFSRHLRGWEILYRRVVGLTFAEIQLKYRQVVGIVFSGLIKVDGASIYDEIPEYRNSPDRKKFIKPGLRGYPVYCHFTNTTYPSISKASKETLITRAEIKFCCEGDIDFTVRNGLVWKFEYGKWEDVSVDWFLSKKDKYSDKDRIAILDIHTGEEYDNITDLTNDIDINSSVLEEYCENPGRHGIIIESIFSSPELHDFEYLVEEDW